jgi:hypothetical protein
MNAHFSVAYYFPGEPAQTFIKYLRKNWVIAS